MLRYFFLWLGVLSFSEATTTAQSGHVTIQSSLSPMYEEPPQIRWEKPLTVRSANHAPVILRGFWVIQKQGLSDSQCGVMIGKQRLMTLGIGDTGMLNCDGLLAAGTVQPDGGAQRIGLIYKWSTLHDAATTAVVLRSVNGRWSVDERYAGKFDDSPAGRSIPALRRALR